MMCRDGGSLRRDFEGKDQEERERNDWLFNAASVHEITHEALPLSLDVSLALAAENWATENGGEMNPAEVATAMRAAAAAVAARERASSTGEATAGAEASEAASPALLLPAVASTSAAAAAAAAGNRTSTPPRTSGLGDASASGGAGGAPGTLRGRESPSARFVACVDGVDHGHGSGEVTLPSLPERFLGRPLEARGDEDTVGEVYAEDVDGDSVGHASLDAGGGGRGEPAASSVPVHSPAEDGRETSERRASTQPLVRSARFETMATRARLPPPRMSVSAGGVESFASLEFSLAGTRVLGDDDPIARAVNNAAAETRERDFMAISNARAMLRRSLNGDVWPEMEGEGATNNSDRGFSSESVSRSSASSGGGGGGGARQRRGTHSPTHAARMERRWDPARWEAASSDARHGGRDKSGPRDPRGPRDDVVTERLASRVVAAVARAEEEEARARAEYERQLREAAEAHPQQENAPVHYSRQLRVAAEADARALPGMTSPRLPHPMSSAATVESSMPLPRNFGKASRHGSRRAATAAAEAHRYCSRVTQRRESAEYDDDPEALRCQPQDARAVERGSLGESEEWQSTDDTYRANASFTTFDGPLGGGDEASARRARVSNSGWTGVSTGGQLGLAPTHWSGYAPPAASPVPSIQSPHAGAPGGLSQHQREARHWRRRDSENVRLGRITEVASGGSLGLGGMGIKRGSAAPSAEVKMPKPGTHGPVRWTVSLGHGAVGSASGARGRWSRGGGGRSVDLLSFQRSRR